MPHESEANLDTSRFPISIARKDFALVPFYSVSFKLYSMEGWSQELLTGVPPSLVYCESTSLKNGVNQASRYFCFSWRWGFLSLPSFLLFIQCLFVCFSIGPDFSVFDVQILSGTLQATLRRQIQLVSFPKRCWTFKRLILSVHWYLMRPRSRL